MQKSMDMIWNLNRFAERTFIFIFVFSNILLISFFLFLFYLAIYDASHLVTWSVFLVSGTSIFLVVVVWTIKQFLIVR